MNKVIIALFILCICASAQSLDSIYTLFLENNQGIKSYTERIIGQKFKADGAAVYPAPEIMLSVNQVPFNDPDLFENAFSQDLKISQMFMPGGKLSAMKNAELSAIPVIAAGRKEYILKTKSEISSLFYKIWIMKQEIELQDSYIKVLRDLIEYESSGNLSRDGNTLSILTLKLELRSSELKIKRMKDEYLTMSTMLFAKAGVSREDSPQFIPVLTNLDTTLNQSTANEEPVHPALSVMEYMRQMWLAEADANSKNIYPDFMLEFMLMRMPRGMPLTTKSPADALHTAGNGETEYMFGVGVKFTLPFLPGYSAKTNAKTEELLASANSVEHDRQNMKSMFNAEYNRYIQDLNAGSKYITSYKTEILPLQRGKAELTRELYLSGKMGITDVINEQKMTIMYEMELLSYYGQFFDLKSKLIPFLENEIEIKD